MVGDGAKHVPRNGLLFAESGGVDSNLHIAQESDTFEGLLNHLLYRSLSGHPAERWEREGGRREDLLNLRSFVAGQGKFALGEGHGKYRHNATATPDLRTPISDHGIETSPKSCGLFAFAAPLPSSFVQTETRVRWAARPSRERKVR